MTTTHLFLSDGWITSARALREEYADRLPEPPLAVRMNVIVTEIPHRDADLDGNIDSSNGQLIIEEGHLDGAELTVTVDYATAKSAFVDRDPQAVMQAFFAGKIIVDGDVSQLMALQGQAGQPTELAEEMYTKMSAFTASES